MNYTICLLKYKCKDGINIFLSNILQSKLSKQSSCTWVTIKAETLELIHK